MSEVLARLAATIAARKGADPESSHTARLLARGPSKCAEKFGEEAVEAVIEAVRGDRKALVAEGADVLYHLAVMLAARDLSLADVLAELERREGVSGVAEKAARKTAAAVRPASGEEELARCLGIRDIVFIGEQGVAPELERDGRDEACRHYIAFLDGEAVGTARVSVDGARAKIQRVAVLPEVRGRGVGTAIMRRILDDLAAEAGVAEAMLDSQTDALPFYEALGFAAEGAEFLDAGIPHRRMRRRLTAG